MNVIDSALLRADQTKAVLLGDGVVSQTGRLFKQLFPGQRAIIIADPNTYKVAGKQICEILLRESIDQEEPFIFTDPDLFAGYAYVEQLTRRLQQTGAIPIAVGSGTINDITKLSSYNRARPYMVAATAASMDGYTAFGASITLHGSKQSIKCDAPRACVADTAIIGNAPSELTASGYADLFAKVTAGADWILADELGVEPIDRFAWSVVQDGLKAALADPEGAKRGDASAIKPLMEGLLLGGFAMQAVKTSRPASGSEHQFSHLWDMEHLKLNGKTVYHGFKVGVGMCAVAALYEKFLNEDIPSLNIERCIKAWPKFEQQQEDALAMFADSDIPTLAAKESGAKYVSTRALRDQLTLLQGRWGRIKERLENQLIPQSEMKRRLKLVGAPTEPEEIGVSREQLAKSFLRAQMIRRRFTVLDVALRIGKLKEWSGVSESVTF